MNFKELKTKAKGVIKQNVWTLLFVGILMSSIFGEYTITRSSNDSLQTINDALIAFQNGEEIKPVEVDENGNEQLNGYTDEIVNEILFGSKDGDIQDINEKFGVTHGIFFSIFGFVTRSKVQLQNFLESVMDIEEKLRITRVLLILVSFFGLVAKVIILNPIFVGENRIFLESRKYTKTRIDRITFCFTKKRYFKTVKAMLKWNVYQALWDITIIGGIIKSYSYKMVKFIIAENPTISGRDAIKISREMMNGKKWETFMLDLSFVGWHFLQVVTFGIVGFWVNTYTKATMCELYASLREDYIKEKKHGYELLNDDILFNNDNEEITKYPDEVVKKKEINYNYNYRPTSIILFFFTFAFVGWAWEVLLYLVRDGVLVNRGTTYGPWLPIYGISLTAVILLVTSFEIFRKLAKNALGMFIFIMVFSTAIEYFGSWMLETLTGLKYWDYSGVFMNINGRVCLECSLFFGAGGSLCLYLVAPFLERQFQKLTLKVRVALCLILLTLFGIDEIYSMKHPHEGEGITSTVSCESRIKETNEKYL